jgi:putative ABC transport system permease protein
MTIWLENFSYRVPISWTVFALAGIAVLIIALVTVSFQSIKSAIANPIQSLRTE